MLRDDTALGLAGSRMATPRQPGARGTQPATRRAGRAANRCAVALSFDSDHETNELRDGGKLDRPDVVGPVRQPRRRAAHPRAAEALEHSRRPSSCPPSPRCSTPTNSARVIAEGHEIGLHGWIHELNSVLPEKDERELHLRSADTLTEITGVRPVGMRTPSWDFSPATLTIQREMGLLYDSSLMADDDPYELDQDGEPTGIVELPVEWIRDDAVYFNMNRFQALRPYTPPAAVLDIFRREFDQRLRGGRPVPADHASACDRLPLAHVHPGRTDPRTCRPSPASGSPRTVTWRCTRRRKWNRNDDPARPRGSAHHPCRRDRQVSPTRHPLRLARAGGFFILALPTATRVWQREVPIAPEWHRRPRFC